MLRSLVAPSNEGPADQFGALLKMNWLESFFDIVVDSELGVFSGNGSSAKHGFPNFRFFVGASRTEQLYII